MAATPNVSRRRAAILASVVAGLAVFAAICVSVGYLLAGQADEIAATSRLGLLSLCAMFVVVAGAAYLLLRYAAFSLADERTRDRSDRRPERSHDISELMDRERELVAAKEAAELASRYKSEFVATMSHELRNPLTSIIGALSIIIANPGAALPAKVVRLMNVALDNSRRLVHLINETLDIEKIEAGLSTFNVAPMKLLDAVCRAVEAMRGFAAGRDVSIRLDPDSAHDVIRGDPERLQQVAINLLSNAIKFSPANGEVAVSVRRAGGNLRLSVADQGPGIPAAFRDRVFERFAQAGDVRGKESSGLGLAIAKSIVVQLGGTVSFDTVDGAGTAFHVDLPAIAPDATRGEAA